MLAMTKFLVSGVFTSMTVFMGTIGNILSIITLLHKYAALPKRQNYTFSLQEDEECLQPLACRYVHGRPLGHPH